jgi:hypothetical protein
MMGLGIRLRKFWRSRLGVVASVLLASLVTLWSTTTISFSPLSLTPRTPKVATASTQVIVDTETSVLIDLRQDTYSLTGLRNRAVLLGNVLASTPVQERIARRVGIPASLIRIQAPLTPEQPAPPVGSANQRTTGDILKSTDEYRLRVQASPSVPTLDIHAQAGAADVAERLADVAVDELKRYVDELARTQQVPKKDQIHIVVMGEAHGSVINGGVGWQTALLVFGLTFAASYGTVVLFARVRAGWRLQADAGSVASP